MLHQDSGFSESNYTYDLNGNIKTLTRYDERGSTAPLDNLSYVYASPSNQMQRVNDSGDKFKGFMDGSSASYEYEYDDNGNMITDLNKGLVTDIYYNYLNLPNVVYRGTNTVRYIYDATGRKIMHTLTAGAVQKQTDYSGEFNYENDVLQYVGHEEGRIVVTKPELLYQNDCSSSADIATTASTSLSTQTTNGENYVKVDVANGITLTKLGVTPMGGTFPVVAGERYKFRVRGYNATAKEAALYVKGNSSDIVWPGANLPRASSADVWTENTFTIPSGVTQITLGVLWTDVTTAVAGTDYLLINAFELERLTAITPEYQYDLKDHLGNVRITFTTKDETVDEVATLEAANLNAESGKFLRIDKAKRVNHAIFDHTNGGATGYSARLSGAADEKFGLAKSVAVMPGDVVYTEVYAKYVDTNTSNWTGAFSTLIGQVAANTAGVVVDGASYSSSTSSFPYGTGYQNTTGSTGGPKAYLNWLIFDKNSAFKTAGYQRLSTTPREYGQDVAHEKLSTTLNITEPGYVYIYLSNEEPTGTPVEVYFDDFKVTHTKSPVVQGQDYYPFGLTFNSYKRENSVINRIKFQGQEHIDDLDLGWDSFKWRNHQPDIGRFFNIDPLAEKYLYNSPYAFSENKVVAHRELEGLESESVNKKETDRQKNATDRELQRRSEGKTPNLNVIPKENTTNTSAKSNTTGGNFQSGDKKEESPGQQGREPFTKDRPLDIVPFNYGDGAQSAEQNIFNGSTDIPAGGVVEGATLNINIEVVEGGNPQTMTIQQGNFSMDGQGAQGPTLLNVNIQDVKGSFSTSIPLNNISPNTNLSVQFSGGGSNRVNVTGAITISGTKPKKP